MHRMRPLAGLLLAFLLFSAHAQAPRERITWGWFGSPPYMIVDGPDTNQGTFDLVRGLLVQGLPQYEHKLVRAPFPRIYHQIRNGDNWCFVGGTRNAEREQFALFSLPVLINLPHKVVLRADQRARFPQGAQSLEQLLTTPGLRTSWLRDRSVNPKVDALLKRFPPSQYHSDFEESLQMLLARRIDFVVETEPAAQYYARQHGHAGELVGLDIREVDQLSYFHVMCPRTPWGKRVIADVDRILRTERPKPTYRAIVEKWLGPLDAARVRAAYQGGFLKGE